MVILSPQLRGAIKLKGTRNAGSAAYRRSKSPLTWETVRAMRAEATAGSKVEYLARKYGVNQKSAWRVIRNLAWHDPEYTPGHVATCNDPDCGVEFRTTRANASYCCARHRQRHHSRLQSGFYDRRAVAQAAPAARRQAKDGLWLARSLDMPIGEGGVLADVVGDGDVLAEVEQRRLAEVLGDLTPEAVEVMSERELVTLRARLAREGFAPHA